MKTHVKIVLLCLLATCLLTVLGCGKGADENKPVSEIKAEAEKMSVSDLRAMATKYKDAISAKTGEIEKLNEKLKKIPVAEMLNKEAKEIKSQIDSISKSMSALKERFQIYYDKLKEKGGDLSGLKI